MIRTSFSVGERIKSFRFAFAGIGFMLKTQHNSRMHLLATFLVCMAGIALKVRVDDWRWLTVAIVMVWFAEAVNTAFEHLCDVVSPEFHASVKTSKDVAAGAVLICAIGAAVLGTMIFVPYVHS